MIEDAPLLRQYAAHRDESAFAELVPRHLNLVYSAAMRRTGGDAHRAEEIAQFVLNELARNAAAVARHPALSGWLHTATRNAALNAARAERRRRLYEQEAFIMNETITPAEGDTDWTRLRPVLDDIIDNLGQQDRDAVVLRFLEGRPFAEIGRALKISEDAARMRTERALEKLRRLLIERGAKPPIHVIVAGRRRRSEGAGRARCRQPIPVPVANSRAPPTSGRAHHGLTKQGSAGCGARGCIQSVARTMIRHRTIFLPCANFRPDRCFPISDNLSTAS